MADIGIEKRHRGRANITLEDQDLDVVSHNALIRVHERIDKMKDDLADFKTDLQDDIREASTAWAARQNGPLRRAAPLSISPLSHRSRGSGGASLAERSMA